MNIEVKEISVGKLFSKDFWFNIPSYQRPYVWNEDNINELLDDITYAFENNPNDKYFMGSLVLQSKGNNEYDILDGQQRLTTISLLLATIRDNINDNELIEPLYANLYQKADRTENIESRTRIIFEIRGEVQEFFNKYIVEKKGTLNFDIVFENEKFKNNISIINILKAIKVIKEYLIRQFDSELLLEDTRGYSIDKFIQFIKKQLIFAYVSSDTREQAFRLFTILNNRGIPLTTADILKSLNLNEVDEKQRNDYAKEWEKLEEQYGDKFDRFLNFIRTMKLKEKARKNLLEEFEEKIYGKLMNYGKESIDYLLKTAENYDKLINLTSNFDNEYKNLITIMKAGFNSEDWIPPLLYYYEKFNIEGLIKFLKLLDNKFMGDWINRETPTKRLENMNKILKAIESAKNYSDILNNKALFSFDNDNLKNIISGNIYGERYCKYLLLKVEYLKLDPEVAYIGNYKNISIEHILPQTPEKSSEWRNKFSDEEREEWTNRIGNLILLTRRKNSQLSNLEFKKKKEKYLESKAVLFTSVFEVYSKGEEWNLENLKNRHSEIINLIMNNL